MTSTRIRLLKFITVFAIGGTERQVVNLVRQLDRSKFDLHMGCFRRWGQFLEEVVSLDIPIHEYGIQRLYDPRTVLQQLKLARLMKQQRIQVVHTYGFYATVFAIPAAKLAGVPATVVSIRDTGELLTEPQKKVQRLICLLADSILVNAEAVRQWLLSQGCDSRKIEVIRNGIELNRFASKSGVIRQQLGLPPDVPVVAMVGRLNRLKGAEFFLKAAATIAARLPSVHFLIVGDVGPSDPNYAEELKREANRLGLQERVTFTGFRLDIADVLAELTVSVLPSLSEGLSNVLLESMAAGVPVVATSVGGNSEIVEDGVSGLLVPPRDGEALGQAVCFLLEHAEQLQRFGQAGKRRIREHFSLEGMVQRTEKHYLKLLEDSVPRADLPLEAVV